MFSFCVCVCVSYLIFDSCNGHFVLSVFTCWLCVGNLNFSIGRG